MGVVASLAPGSEIIIGVVHELPVQMADGKDNIGPGDRMRLMISCSAVGILWASFASVSRTRKDTLSYFLPLGRVLVSHLGTDRHLLSLQAFQPSPGQYKPAPLCSLICGLTPKVCHRLSLVSQSHCLPQTKQP